MIEFRTEGKKPITVDARFLRHDNSFHVAIEEKFQREIYDFLPEGNRYPNRCFLFRDSVWSFESEAKRVSKPVQEIRKSLQALSFIEKESCIIAPWSRCLGPVGLVPTSLEFTFLLTGAIA